MTICELSEHINSLVTRRTEEGKT